MLSLVEHEKSFITLGPDVDPKPFDTLIMFLKEFFEKVYFEKKNQQTTKQKREQLPSMQRVKCK